MAFTPNEIRNKEFTRVKNGLEPAEVSDFLTQLSNEIERLKEEKKQLEKVLEERDTNIKSYQVMRLFKLNKLENKQKLLLQKNQKQLSLKQKRKLM